MKERIVKRNLLSILAIFSIFLLLSMPYFYEQSMEKKKGQFINDVKYILERIGEKRLMTVDFDIGMVSEKTLKEILGIQSDNYENIKIKMIAEKVHITAVGKNKWEGLIACGTIEGISVVKKDAKCV